MATNGNIGLSLVSAGTFKVYYNTSPNGDWNNPATFSSGRLIATFTRTDSLFPAIGPIGVHNLSEVFRPAALPVHGQLITSMPLPRSGRQVVIVRCH